jgi:hypothetical protein
MTKTKGPKAHPMSLAKLRYARHRAQSKFRGIEFKFTFEEWYQWWLANGIDKNLPSDYPTEHDRMCMCRLGDQGAYEPSNVYMASAVKNVVDAVSNGRHRSQLVKRYRWGDQLVDYREIKELIKDVPKAQAFHYYADRYDQYNVKETMKLINRWRVYTRTHVTVWTTTDGSEFDSRQAAADHMQISLQKYVWLQHKGSVQKVRRLIALPLKEYILTHSRFPDPYLPPNLE